MSKAKIDWKAKQPSYECKGKALEENLESYPNEHMNDKETNSLIFDVEKLLVVWMKTKPAPTFP